MNIEKNCKACGDLITVRLTDHKRGWGNYCDKACAAAYKCGQRPRDVNAGHAKTSKWAEDRMNAFSRYKGGKPPVAQTVKEQVGKNVKIGPKPVRVNIDCSGMGQTALRGLFDQIRTEMEYIDPEGSGWDAHKAYRPYVK